MTTYTIRYLPGKSNSVTDYYGYSSTTSSWDFTESLPDIERVVYRNNKTTTVYWSDHTTTKVSVHGEDVFSEEAGLAAAIVKKLYGRSAFLKIVKNAIRAGKKDG